MDPFNFGFDAKLNESKNQLALTIDRNVGNVSSIEINWNAIFTLKQKEYFLVLNRIQAQRFMIKVRLEK